MLHRLSSSRLPACARDTTKPPPKCRLAQHAFKNVRKQANLTHLLPHGVRWPWGRTRLADILFMFFTKTGTGHPTITSPEQGLSVLSRFAGDFVAPGDHEGYDRILNVKLSDCPTTPDYNRTDISVILQRVRDSTPVAATHGFPPYSPSNRGHSRGGPHRGWRGRGAPTMNGNFRGGTQEPGGYVPNSRGSRGWNTSSFRGNNGAGRSRPDRGRGRGVWQPTAGDGQSG